VRTLQWIITWWLTFSCHKGESEEEKENDWDQNGDIHLKKTIGLTCHIK